MQIELKNIFKTPDNENHFFGYFDVPQLSIDNQFFLTQQINDIYNYPSVKEKYNINLFDLKNNTRKIIGSTKCLNFQQGCRLQFLGPDFKNHVIYNDIVKNKYISRIINLINGDIKTLNYPIASVSPKGDIFAHLDYERLYWYRKGYSYNNIINENKKKPILENDSIKFIDILKNEKISEIYLKDLINFKKLDTMNDSIHYIEHPLFSPFGDKIVFLHRWRLKDKGIFTRLYCYNLINKNLKLILDSGRVSHFGWKDNTSLIIYGAKKNLINNLRKKKYGVGLFKHLLPVYKKIIKDNFWISKVITNDSYLNLNTENAYVEKIAPELRSQDGHPSIYSDNNSSFFITDDYADSDNNSSPSLYFYDLNKKYSKKILTVSSISELDNSPLRCDLHPRLSYDGSLLSIDTLDRGYRQSYLYKININ